MFRRGLLCCMKPTIPELELQLLSASLARLSAMKKLRDMEAKKRDCLKRLEAKKVKIEDEAWAALRTHYQEDPGFFVRRKPKVPVIHTSEPIDDKHVSPVATRFKRQSTARTNQGKRSSTAEGKRPSTARRQKTFRVKTRSKRQ